MALSGTINSNKDLALNFQPLLLCVFTFSDGTILRCATHSLTSAEGTAYNGNDYKELILQQDIEAAQALSEQGIDIIPSASINLNDADNFLYIDFEAVSGFKGATAQLNLVLWQTGTGNFSSDMFPKFVGVCSSPAWDESTGIMTVTAVNKLNLQKVSAPFFPIQKRCGNVFPTTAAQRLDGANNSDSPFYSCGYSPDASGANARGNLNGGVPFVDCSYTKQACLARGMF